MAKRTSPPSINIRPDVGVYATYRRLSYRPWYAIAEFVDNSTQSYQDNRRALRKTYRDEGEPGHLIVDISYDHENSQLVITDNANGMELEELTRAIVLDRPPPDPSGRSEFGMGLKTAACWFGETWTIETSKLGSKRALKVRIHVPNLVKTKEEQIQVDMTKAAPAEHYTRITIDGLYKPIWGRTPGRIRVQLGSMYRQDLRSGEVEIVWNGEAIAFSEAPILEEKLPGGKKRTWRKKVSFKVPWIGRKRQLEVTGWIGLRIPASQRDAGFALLRRNRVIVGGPGEGYKPVEVFGQGNTFRSQRLVGELDMDRWPVTQAKDAFDWSGGLEDAFVERLKKACREYMDFAEQYRNVSKKVTATEMVLASEKTQQVFEDSRFGDAIRQEIAFPEPRKTEKQVEDDTNKLRELSTGPVTYKLDVGTSVWTFRLFWQSQLSDAHWMQVSYPQDDQIDVFLNTAHPFFAKYVQDRDTLELIQRFVLSLALAEHMARQTSDDGLIHPGDFRNHMNRVLRRSSEIEADSRA